MLSDYNRIKLESNNRKNSGEILMYWKLNNTCVDNLIKEPIKRKIKKYYKLNKN